MALTADHQLELSAPLAVSGWQLTTTPNLDQPFTPADLTSSIISCGTPERPALTIRPENSARFFRFRKF